MKSGLVGIAFFLLIIYFYTYGRLTRPPLIQGDAKHLGGCIRTFKNSADKLKNLAATCEEPSTVRNSVYFLGSLANPAASDGACARCCGSNSRDIRLQKKKSVKKHFRLIQFDIKPAQNIFNIPEDIHLEAVRTHLCIEYP